MADTCIQSPSENARASQKLLIGLDVGSTTVKAVALDAATHEPLFRRYERHHARQALTAAALLDAIASDFPATQATVSVTGSGATELAEAIGAPYIQEVVANANALAHLHPGVRTAIELGGQDAKIIFFSRSAATGETTVEDMRMNGSCAGGTGAFIDEIATLLNIPVEEFNGYAERGETPHPISGRCGVYAKTDIQPLLNRGVPKEDLALSTFHAIAKQTIGGLAQGLDINPPVAFEGGPLTFNPELVRVFAERLGLNEGDVVTPRHAETVVALGAALALEGPLARDAAPCDLVKAAAALRELDAHPAGSGARGRLFFATETDREDFQRRHPAEEAIGRTPRAGETVDAYLGIDSGSTTTKFVLLDDAGEPIESFYSSNKGEPLDVAREALIALRDRYRAAGARLNVRALGTTGYGEQLFAEAFHADVHMVETVAHARAALVCDPQATFLLDIGGQDMKAIWLEDGIITNIVLNEACSSGCGSFLEGFASTLGIPVCDIARQAFQSTDPAVLGSRCTVFMNSSIVTEQRNGKTGSDIMAGLCRSIIENVFTKVIRVSNLDSLGEHIVVQGGTFANDAVLRAFEQYVGRPVTRAPHPGLQGAIGAALAAREKAQMAAGGAPFATSFIGLDALDDFTYSREDGLICPFCQNHCSRSAVTFSSGSTFITGNRCERGSVLGDAADPAVRQRLKEVRATAKQVPNLFEEREKLLFAEYPHKQVLPQNGTVIGLPRVLSLWDEAPFWRTLLESLGFTVVLSAKSNRALYEAGLPSVTSDTVCFPAKLAHGHVRDLAHRKVDRIFMPMVTVVESENAEDTSQSRCAVVKGYPMVVRSSDNPERRWGIPFDAPLFHWYTNSDRVRQLEKYFLDTFGIDAAAVGEAIREADHAQASFKQGLQDRGEAVMEAVERDGSWAVILASRPYQNDRLVNHDLPRLFCEQGVPVLTADSVPALNDVGLMRSRIDIVNNYHARVLESALYAAGTDGLELAQIVSFGCGHDAYLSDEAIRLMKESSGTAPLILKVDESDAEGSLRIRVRSFVETVNIRRAQERAGLRAKPQMRPLRDPYAVKFREEDRRRVVLVPNTSHAFSRLLACAFSHEGIACESLPVGRDRAIALGKRYVHNDICFPAQIVIGEALEALESGRYDDADVAIGMAKYIGDCRLTHYTALLRKALDDSGHASVPIITNDDVDSHDIHPAFKLGVGPSIEVAMGLPMIDALEELLRKIRPYEIVPGSANEAFEAALDCVIDGLARDGVRGAQAGFKQAIDIMASVRYDRSRPKPRVLIVGEYLLNFHPGANHDIELYLEANGLEVVEARMTDVIRKTYFYQHAQVREYHVKRPLKQRTWMAVADHAFDVAHAITDRIAKKHPLYEPACRMTELVRDSDPIVHHTFDAGEGVLIPGEILHHAKNGVRGFVILQPFGCLPNHVVGRGIVKSLKERYPSARILPLDYDPDVSFANIENRLQMLVMGLRRNETEGC